MSATFARVVESGLQAGEKVVPVLTAIIAENQSRLLPEISAKIQQAVASGTAKDALSVLDIFSRYGFKDNSLALAAAVAVRPEISRFSVSHLLSTCVSFSRQKSRIPQIFDALIPRLVALAPEISARQKLAAIEALALLRVPLPPELVPTVEDLKTGSASRSDLVRFTYALCLPTEAPGPVLVEALNSLALQLEPTREWWDENMTHRQYCLLMQVREYLRFCLKDQYSQLAPSTREILTQLSKVDFGLYDDPKSSSLFVKRASEALTKLRVGHSANTWVGPFKVDILERDQKIVWDLCNREKYISSVTGAPDQAGNWRFRERTLKAMGYKIIQLPYWHWQRIKMRRARIEYMRQTRYRTTRDKREEKPRELSDQSTDPTKFDAEAAAYEYVGETFFKPQQLKRPWVWKSHRPGALPTILTL